jgi:hypothetical protein
MSATANISPEIPPKFIACLIDVSGQCSPELIERCGGKVYISGFFDDSVNTHLCSFSPSVWVEVVSIEPERYPEDETASNDLNEELLGLLTHEDNDYWNRRDIERMKEANPDHFKDLDFDFDEGLTDNERHDEVREHLQGNPVF